MPGFGRQVVEAVGGSVSFEPAVAAAAGVDHAAVLGEVDGETLLVHRLARARRRRTALRCRLVVDVVIAGSAMRPAERDLLRRVAVALAPEVDARCGRR